MATPITEFAEFDISAAPPSGLRHNAAAPGFLKVLGSTAASALQYGSINIDTKTEGATKVLLFRRFWAPEIPNPIGSLDFNMEIQASWIVDNELGEASGKVPTTLPTSQNLFRGNSAKDGTVFYEENHFAMSGITDNETSQYIYTNITADVDVSTGRYGTGGRDSFTYRCTFDYL
jgi:hypothetical protein